MVSRYWISKETNWPALGITIYDPEFWGEGFGYEALGIWCQYLFDNEPKFVRLDLRTWSGNIGMTKVAEKLGFTKEAVFRMARIVEGEYYHSNFQIHNFPQREFQKILSASKLDEFGSNPTVCVRCPPGLNWKHRKTYPIFQKALLTSRYSQVRSMRCQLALYPVYATVVDRAIFVHALHLPAIHHHNLCQT